MPLAVAAFMAITQPTNLAETNPAPLSLKARFREPSKNDPARFEVRTKTLQWDPSKTAIIVCDMWDRHWCAGATGRVSEMAPVMNEVLKNARERGVFIVHAPSDTMDFYKDSPQRKRAQHAPHAKPPTEIHTWRGLDPGREPPLPIDDSDGGCDDQPMCRNFKAWTRQHPAIEIADQDAVTDRGEEVYNLLQEHGVTSVVIMGVHTNMCVLGRPFSIRRMVGVGKNVVLMRDMTDTMYNPRMKPHVSHFAGTDLVVEHIEKYWCPSITSADFTRKPTFRFRSNQSSPRR